MISETENCHTCLIQQIFLSEEGLNFETTLLSEKWHEESQQGFVVIPEDKIMLSNLWLPNTKINPNNSSCILILSYMLVSNIAYFM